MKEEKSSIQKGNSNWWSLYVNQNFSKSKQTIQQQINEINEQIKRMKRENRLMIENNENIVDVFFN